MEIGLTVNLMEKVDKSMVISRLIMVDLKMGNGMEKENIGGKMVEHMLVIFSKAQCMVKVQFTIDKKISFTRENFPKMKRKVKASLKQLKEHLKETSQTMKSMEMEHFYGVMEKKLILVDFRKAKCMGKVR